MEAILEETDSMNPSIFRGIREGMEKYVEGVMRKARNLSVLRASEFLNFSYQRLQYLVSEARFKDRELETKRLQWAVSHSTKPECEFNLVIDDT